MRLKLALAAFVVIIVGSVYLYVDSRPRTSDEAYYPTMPGAPIANDPAGVPVSGAPGPPDTAPPALDPRVSSATEAYSLELRDIQPSGMAQISFSGRKHGQGGSAYINLLTGKLYAESQLPAVGSGYSDASPSGNYRATTEGAIPHVRLRVLDRENKEVAQLADKSIRYIVDVRWNKTSDAFTYMAVRLDGRVKDLCAYSVKSRKNYLLAKGVTDDSAVFSPAQDKIAFLDRAIDEYGDMDNYAVRVADLRLGRVRTITVNRRKPSFIWAGDSQLAITAYDEYRVPTLSLVDMEGRASRLVTKREVARIEMVAYLRNANRIVYIAHGSLLTGERPDELWAVEPGKKSVRLFPKNVRTAR